MSHPLLRPGTTRVMGILNVTPDSFSDGGAFFDQTLAIERGGRLQAEGAEIVDVGGESTRPGAQRIPIEEELRRVLPVVAGLSAIGVVSSIDTTRAEVAKAAVEAGAQLVNDVSGGLADDRMLAVVAELGVPYICMHWRGHSAAMAQAAHYDDVVSEVRAELGARKAAALEAGVAEAAIILDPGLGFAKTAAHNWEILRRLPEIATLGSPLLIGASRKRFLGDLLVTSAGQRPPRGRGAATLALTTVLASQGIWGVRTHDVQANRDAIAVVSALQSHSRAGAE